MPPHNVDARFGLKPHRLGNRVGEAFFERCFVVGLFVADFFQIRIMAGGRTRLLTTAGRGRCDTGRRFTPSTHPNRRGPPRYGARARY
jgi:hypothetical protein